MDEEKRRFTRVPFKVQVEMAVDDVLYHTAQIKNLGLGGCLLPISAELKAGTLCQIRIQLSGASSDMDVRVDGKIARCDSGVVAVSFSRISPDSLFHLHNIIRYNCTEPDQIEWEIFNHLDLSDPAQAG